MAIINRGKSTKSQLAHVTQEMYKQNLELAERNKTLTLLRQIDELVLGPNSGSIKITQTIAELLVSESDFMLAAVYVADKTKSHATAESIATSGSPPSDVLADLKLRISNLPLHHNAQSIVSHAAKTNSVQLTSAFSRIRPTITEADDEQFKKALGIQTLFVSPLKSGSGLMGLLLLGIASKKDETPEFLKNLAERLTTTISIAVENHLLFEELQEASARLRVQNKKLRELDKTKDDFISMASHQLRTPLTVIKGYVNMVVKGDAGKINEQQTEFLGHALSSTDNMTSLVTELLSVSRITSGKFVIEATPTNLADLVDGCVGQLANMAAEKKIDLKFSKPKDFPVLLLDADKTKQVVSNFIDNAIHYSRSKGAKINVELSYSEADGVVFKVVDNGIGVPASEKDQLFTKFFRGKNARVARPDGTGVGIYLAKVVIQQQGGDLIFESKEGVGSTFGFKFKSDKVVKPSSKTK